MHVPLNLLLQLPASRKHINNATVSACPATSGNAAMLEKSSNRKIKLGFPKVSFLAL